MGERGRGSSTVLLVDDRADVAETTALHLERQGRFDVRIEHGAGDALATLGGSIDCVVSDYEMPGRNGLDLLREVRDRRPDLPFILFTGRGSEEIASEAISAGVTDYLQKESGTDQYAVLANRIENAVARRRSEAAAAASENRYRRLVESLPHAVLVHDGSTVLYANDRVRSLIGADDVDAVYDVDPLRLVHPADRERIAERMRRTIAGEELIDPAEFRIERLDGTERWIESRGRPVVYDGQQASQVVLVDVTDRRRHEQRLEALHEATRHLFTADGRERVAAIAVETLGDVLDEPLAGVWGYDGAAESLCPLAASDRAREVAGPDGPDADVVALPDWSVETAVYRSGTPTVIDDYGRRDDAVTDELATVYAVPLEDYGLLTVAAERPRTFSDAERDLIGILARALTAAFDRIEDE